MNKYTPGPWRFIRTGWGCQVIAGSTVVCALDTDVPTMPKKTIERRLANARLIAVTPELLEACKGLLEYRDRNTLNFQLEKADDWLDLMRAAIAKAENQ